MLEAIAAACEENDVITLLRTGEFLDGQEFTKDLLQRILGHSRIERLPSGKPIVNGLPTLHFSHSNKKNALFYGFSKEVEVGVDIEDDRLPVNADEIVSVFFSQLEKKAFKEHALEEKMKYFFRLWTLKRSVGQMFSN